MLIIVEGVDGVGKTTLVQTLESRIRELDPGCSVEILHRGPPQSSFLEEYELALQDYWPGDGKHVICDRWHIGEHVYGPLLRGLTPAPWENYHVERFLHSRGALVVLAAAPVDKIIERRGQRGGEDLLKNDQVRYVQDRFLDITWRSSLGAQVFHVQDGDNERDVLTILKNARTLELEAVPLTGFKSYVGPCHPEVILLGERRNIKRDDRWTGAFVPVGGSAGHYLLRALTSDVGEMAGFANALEENVPALYSVLGQPAVVALGVEARRVCLEENIPHGAVPHPQFIRRFHHRSLEEYGEAIRYAALFEEDLSAWRP